MGDSAEREDTREIATMASPIARIVAMSPLKPAVTAALTAPMNSAGFGATDIDAIVASRLYAPIIATNAIRPGNGETHAKTITASRDFGDATKMIPTTTRNSPIATTGIGEFVARYEKCDIR